MLISHRSLWPWPQRINKLSYQQSFSLFEIKHDNSGYASTKISRRSNFYYYSHFLWPNAFLSAETQRWQASSDQQDHFRWERQNIITCCLKQITSNAHFWPITMVLYLYFTSMAETTELEPEQHEKYDTTGFLPPKYFQLLILKINSLFRLLLAAFPSPIAPQHNTSHLDTQISPRIHQDEHNQ